MYYYLNHNLFSESSTYDLNWETFHEKFVNDVIDEKEILRWDNLVQQLFVSSGMSVFVNAPTGSGKNYFVLHNLRDYTMRYGGRILYLSNRVALDAQMRKELAEITGVESRFDEGVILDEYTEEFYNITAMTYQKMARILLSQDSALDFLKRKYKYVVCDEAHFFVADALFNPATGYLLDELIRRYFNCIRIYLSATFDEALAPIYCSECKCFEDNAIKLDKTNSSKYYINASAYNNTTSFARYFSAMNPKVLAYRFNRDFSPYNPRFFDDLKEIEDAIISDFLGKTNGLFSSIPEMKASNLPGGLTANLRNIVTAKLKSSKTPAATQLPQSKLR